MTTEEVRHAGVLQTIRETPVAARFALLGVFVNQFGAFLQFFLVLYLTQRGFSDALAGVALGAYSAGAIVGVLLGGTMTDRLGPRWTIVVAVGSAALFTLSVTTLDEFAAIVVAVALSGAMSQAARPAVSALLFGLVPQVRHVMVFALYRTASNAGSILGPLVAVWLSTISWDLVFYFDAGCALTYCAIAAFLLPRGRVGTASENNTDNTDTAAVAAAAAAAADPIADDAGPAVSTAPAAAAAIAEAERVMADAERATWSATEPTTEPTVGPTAGTGTTAGTASPAGEPTAGTTAGTSVGTASAGSYLTLLRDHKYLAYLTLMLGNGLVHVQFFAVLPLMLVAGGYPTWVYGALATMSAVIVVSGELVVTRTTQRWAAWTATITGWILLVIGRGAYGLPGGLTLLFAASAIAAIGQIIGGAQAFAYPAKVAPAGAVGRYLGAAQAMFGLGYAIGPGVGILLWTVLGDGFWAICFVVGMAMVLPGVWGMRQPVVAGRPGGATTGS